MSVIQNIKEIQEAVKMFEDAFEKGRQKGIKEGMERASVIALEIHEKGILRGSAEGFCDAEKLIQAIRKEIDND